MIVVYIKAAAIAAIAIVDHVPAATAADDELIVGLDSLSIRSSEVEEDDGDGDTPEPMRLNDDGGVRRNGGDGIIVSDEDLEGLRRMGRRQHRFNELENLFHDFEGEVEWGNEDYDHNQILFGQFAPNDA